VTAVVLVLVQAKRRQTDEAVVAASEVYGRDSALARIVVA
jgi:hypothetical protein